MGSPVNEELWLFNKETPKMLKVIGVLKDYNFESLRDDIRPMIIRLTPRISNLIVRFNTENPQQAINLIEAKWNKVVANEPFDFDFLNQKFDSLYQSEQRIGTLFTTFTIMAIVIASLLVYRGCQLLVSF
jgi:putative ABC transport system permease protein